MKPAERPDQQQDRDRHAQQPQQQITSHRLTPQEIPGTTRRFRAGSRDAIARGMAVRMNGSSEPGRAPPRCWTARALQRGNRINPSGSRALAGGVTVESPNFPPPASRGRVPLELTDPKPLAATVAFWRSAAQFSTIGIFIIMIGAVLDLARVVLLPVTCAIVIGAMFGPLIRLAVAYRIPSWLGATVVVVAFLLLLQAATLLVSAPIIAVVS